MTKDLNTPSTMAVIIVDHGSRRENSNQMLLDVVDRFRSSYDYSIVEPAHMELAAPSIRDAFDRCVAQGAETIVIHPYFLLPGRHWNEDIPRLAAEAAASHRGVQYLVTAPVGLHPRMSEVIQDRIEQCLAHASREGVDCELCAGTDKCEFRP